MRTSLALRQGVLWIAQSGQVTRVAPYDVNGRRLGKGFSFGGADGTPADVRAIALDEDRRIWAADAASGTLRAFTAFGSECGSIRGEAEPGADLPEAYGDAVGLAAQGIESDARLLLGRRGVRRHALLWIDPARGRSRSLRPDGDPQGSFQGLAGVALAGRLAFACERGRRSVQVFRDGDFHFRFRVQDAGEGAVHAEPCAVAALSDGRSVVACSDAAGGSVFLFGPGGRCLRRLAGNASGSIPEEATVENPSGIAVHEGISDRSTVVLVLDRDGDRVQALNLDGRSFGSFQDAIQADPAGPARSVEVGMDAPRPGRKQRPGPSR